MNERMAFLAVVSAALLAACQNSGDAGRTLAVSGVYSGGDRHWIDVLDVIAADRGYFSRPDYEPKGAPYRTVMTYTKMMTKHDSITFLLAQDRSTKKYFGIVWDLPTARGWSSEALRVKTVIAEQIGEQNVRLTKAWMEHYSSNQSLQPTALWRCASMSILISLFSVGAQPRSQSGG
jgi:hypothetical protein